MKMPKENGETPQMEAQAHDPKFLRNAAKLSAESAKSIREKMRKKMSMRSAVGAAY